MKLLFIFDMDDVLYDYDWRVRMAGMTELTGLSLQELRERWWHDRGEWAAEAGDFATPEAYLSAFEEAIGMPIDEAEWVRVRKCGDDGMAGVARGGAPGIRTRAGDASDQQRSARGEAPADPRA